MIEDIETYLDIYFKSKDIVFVSGSKAVQNLFENESELQSTKVHFFCDPILRIPTRTKHGGKIVSITSKTSFALAVTSTMDMPYFNEMNTDNQQSKYNLNIKPLILLIDQIIKDFHCAGLEVKEDYIPAINLKDINFDGIIGTITFVQYV
jgi:hypothetical protein